MIESFEHNRPMLLGIAYRMLGSMMEAEDIVQEAYLRYQDVPQEEIRSTKSYLSTIVTRLCLNQLNSAQSQREIYTGPWLPEPIITHGDSHAIQATPGERMVEHESISMAFMILLESLNPVERAVFLLREVFDYDYGEIATIVDKSEVACRQIFSRAKKHIAENRPRFDHHPEQHRILVQQFIAAVEGGELAGIMNFLAEDVTLYADGGGKTYGAATRPVHGKEHAALFILGSLRFLPTNAQFDVEEINSQPGVILRDEQGHTLGVLSLEIVENTVNAVRYIGNPDKLKSLPG